MRVRGIVNEKSQRSVDAWRVPVRTMATDGHSLGNDCALGFEIIAQTFLEIDLISVWMCMAYIMMFDNI